MLCNAQLVCRVLKLKIEFLLLKNKTQYPSRFLHLVYSLLLPYLLPELPRYTSTYRSNCCICRLCIIEIALYKPDLVRYQYNIISHFNTIIIHRKSQDRNQESRRRQESIQNLERSGIECFKYIAVSNSQFCRLERLNLVSFFFNSI